MQTQYKHRQGDVLVGRDGKQYQVRAQRMFPAFPGQRDPMPGYMVTPLRSDGTRDYTKTKWMRQVDFNTFRAHTDQD